MNDQQRAAMQMALEALEDSLLAKEYYKPTTEEVQRSITALKNALAQSQDKGENNGVSAMADVEQNRMGSGAKDVEAAIEATKEEFIEIVRTIGGKFAQEAEAAIRSMK